MKSLIKYCQLILLLTLTTFTLFGQQYGNEWIDFSKTHYKFQSDSNGLHRINYDALAQSGIDLSGSAFKLLTSGTEIPIYVSTDETFGPNDYIEFYGTINDGSFDTQLYATPAFQPQPDASLFDDTKSYFLVSDSSEPHLRFQDEQNDVSNFGPAEPYFMHKSKSIDANSNHFGKPLYDSGTYSYPSAFDEGEGFVSSIITNATTSPYAYRINTEELYQDAATEATVFFKIIGRNSSANVVLNQHITIDVDDEIYIDVFSNDYDIKDHSFNLPLSKINNEVDPFGKIRTTFNITALNGVDNGNSYETNVSVCNASVTYPRSFNFDGYNDFLFNVDVPSSKYFEITDFGNSSDIVLYDLTASKRIIPVFENDQQRFIVNANGTINHKLFIANESAAHTVENLTTKTFTDYSSSANQGDYILLTHGSLIPDPDELVTNDYVDDYKTYRESDAGGNHNVIIVEISELYDQYAQGIEQHPLSIKNFINYALDNWSNAPSYLNILGKGVRYDKIRYSEEARAVSLIPSFGYPTSDNQFVIRNEFEMPQLAIGRVPVKSREELAAYLYKVIEHEALQANICEGSQDWMKDILLIAKGWSIAETEKFKNLLNETIPVTDAEIYNIVDVLKDTSVPSSTPNSNPTFATHLNNGLAMISYMGHSVPMTSYWQFDVEAPENYNNNGKYPFIYSNSPFGGGINMFDDRTCMAEDFILAENKGAIAFLGKTDFSNYTTNHQFTLALMEQIMVSNYGNSLGTSIQRALNELVLQTTGKLRYYEFVDFSFAGDPAIKIHNTENCDGIVEGCTEPPACNYDVTATTDDGSCDFGDTECPDPCNVIYGCLDANDCLYNPDATCHFDAFCSPLVDTNCPDPCNEILGCTDANACNYDSNANCEDGSCEFGIANCPEPCYVVYGCTDQSSCSFNPEATCEDGSCASDCDFCCTDPTACNYDPACTFDSGTCEYGIIDCPEPCDAILGCRDATACNYSPFATCDDNSCEYQSCQIDLKLTITVDKDYVPVGESVVFTITVLNEGQNPASNIQVSDSLPSSFTNTLHAPSIGNYNTSTGLWSLSLLAGQSATLVIEVHVTEAGSHESIVEIISATPNDVDSTPGNNDISEDDQDSVTITTPTITGCTDATACNYNEDATVDDGTCDFGNDDCPDKCNVVLGCTDPYACNYDPSTTCDDGSCDLGIPQCPEPCNVVYGCTDPIYCNYDANATCDDGSCQDHGDQACPQPCDNIYGCTDPDACNYEPNATCDDGSCDWGVIECPDPCNVIYGCTNLDACNYDVDATCDDGSCDFGNTNCPDPCDPNCDSLGCTDPCSSNYNPNSSSDDGSCEPYNTVCNSDCTVGDVEVWSPANCACITISESVNGCTDANACNYNAEANCDDDSCLVIGQQVGNSVVDVNCQLVVIPNECIEDCVWPGDSNNDGVANNFDLFNIGWAFDATGTSRINASTDWSPQFSLNWQESFDSGADYKHADCDGDGTIYRDDIEVITNNYGNTVGKTDEFESSDIPLNIFVNTDTIDVGAFLKIDFALGDSENIVDVYGVAFTLEYDPLYLQEEDMEITFPNSWMGNINNTISIHQNFPEEGKIEIAYSRTDHLSVTGSGTFGYAIVEIDNLDGKTDISEIFKLKLSNTLMMDGAQERFTLVESETTVLVTGDNTTSISEINASEQNIDIYPNPASDVLNINCDDNISSLRIYNTTGKILMEQNSNDKQLSLNQLTSGFYLVEITTDKGTVLKKLIISE